MNLIRADFYRLLKNKAFYILLALIFLMPMATCAMFPEASVETIIFRGLDTTLFCSISGIMIALFVGKDYDNHTIRNKICYGEKRLKIMGATFLESALVCLAFAVTSILSSLAFGGIFCVFSFSEDFAAKLLCQIAILLAFSAVVAAITMCAKSMKIGLVVALMISILLSSVGQMLPMLSVSSPLAAFLCRVLYSTVSSNLLNSVNGTYAYVSYAQGVAIFDRMYLNSLLLALVYLAVSLGVSAVVVKKQSYK
ncbi:MAG: hypothetical protein ACI4U2_06145 [Christensenellaceae bacterium]